KIAAEKYTGKNFSKSYSVGCEIFTDSNRNQWYPFQTYDEYVTLCKLANVTPQANPSDGKVLNLLSDLMHDMKAMQQLKKSSIESYKRLTLLLPMGHMYNAEYARNLRKSDWVLLTHRLEIDGKMIALSRLFTWMYRDFREDPVDKMSH